MDFKFKLHILCVLYFQDWEYNAYKIFDPALKNGTIDIPMEFRDIKLYCASLAHKTNHSFLPNAEFVAYDHPRFGLIPCLLATHDIEPDEEIFVHYGYELNGCPDWYEEAWLSGKSYSGFALAFSMLLLMILLMLLLLLLLLLLLMFW